MHMASVRVAVRARPLNERELDLQSDTILSVTGNTLSLAKPKSADFHSSSIIENGQSLMTRSLVVSETASSLYASKDVRDFSFDFCFWSCQRNDKHFVGQEEIYRRFGSDVVTAAYQGYNACIFAYGQTGSGKTYTMMGSEEEPGLIPRICQDLFGRMNSKEQVSYRTEVSYMEIYNERVHDLLKREQRSIPTSNPPPSLRVREHPKNGPYVESLSQYMVTDFHDIEELMEKGNRVRHTAATKMNDTSSRSHAIFTIIFTQAKFSKDLPEEKFSKIHLVDLAGSERAQSTGATGQRLKEGGCINRSLVLLGNVISTLAEKSTNKKNVFVPYRDSVLTWLLKDSLGGNSKTMMIATVSPAACNYGETMSTLRYASRAKSIVNRPEVNEDPSVKVIRELRAEIQSLRQLLASQGSKLDPSGRAGGDRVAERLQEQEARVAVLTQAWTDRWRETVSVLEEEGELDLKRLHSGIVLDSKLPYLALLSEDDRYATGLQLFPLKVGDNSVGSDASQTIVLRGSLILPQHCCITMEPGPSEGGQETAETAEDGKPPRQMMSVMLNPREGAHCAINNEAVSQPRPLRHGFLVSFGEFTLFRFNNPAEAQLMQRAGIVNERNNLSFLNRSLLDDSKTVDKSYSAHSGGEDVSDGSRLQDQRLVEEEESQRKLLEKRRELEELEEQVTLTEQRYHRESQKKEKELEVKRQRLEELQNSLDATRTRLDTHVKKARRSSLGIDVLRKNTSPAELFKRLQEDLEQKYETLRVSELDKLGEESRELEERRERQRQEFEKEEAALRSALIAKRTEREEAHAELDRLSDDMVTLDTMLRNKETTPETYAEASNVVTHELKQQAALVAALDAELNQLSISVPEQLEQLKERRQSLEADQNEAARDLELRKSALERELRERLNKELCALVEDLVRNSSGEAVLPQTADPNQSVREGCIRSASFDQLPTAASQTENFPSAKLGATEKEVMTLQMEVQAAEESLLDEQLVIADEKDSVEWKRWRLQEMEQSHRLSTQIEAEVSRRMLALAREKEETRLREEKEEEEAVRLREEEEAARVREERKERARREELISEENERHEQSFQRPFWKQSHFRIRTMKKKHRKQLHLCRNASQRGDSSSPMPTSSNSSSSNEDTHHLRTSASTLVLSPSDFSYRSRSLRSLNVTASSDQLNFPRDIQISITICRFIQRTEYIDYEILCRVGAESWTVCRRYSLIRQFHEELRKNYPEIKSIPFPPKTNFWVNSNSEQVAERRVEDLQTYFRELVKYLQKHPYCLLNPEKSRIALCRRIVCQVLPILHKGEFETSRYGTA